MSPIGVRGQVNNSFPMAHATHHALRQRAIQGHRRAAMHTVQNNEDYYCPTFHDLLMNQPMKSVSEFGGRLSIRENVSCYGDNTCIYS